MELLQVVGHAIQFHIHGLSEHTFDRTHMDLEIHLVHKTEAGESAVVGFFVFVVWQPVADWWLRWRAECRKGADICILVPQLEGDTDGSQTGHIIVSLQGPVKNYIPVVPFHTSVLEWKVGPPLSEIDDEKIDEYFNKLYKSILVNIRILMETLCVEEEPEHVK